MFTSPLSLRSFAALALVFFILVSTSASVTQYSSRVWQMDDGLPQNSVQALAQTADGYLWIGTQNGLARFDGVRFTIFDNQNVTAFKNASVTALLTARDGKLWVGTPAGLIE